MSGRACGRLKRLGSFVFILLLSILMFSILFASLQDGLLSRATSIGGLVGWRKFDDGSGAGVQEGSGSGTSGIVQGTALEVGMSILDQWPMFHHDLQHTGYSSSTRAHANYKLWNYTTGGAVWSSPAVVDGRVYVGSYDNETYCLNASTGTLVWHFATGGQIWSSPAVIDGRLYIGSFDNKTYCLDASTGTLIWNYTTGGAVWSSPAVVDGRVYVGSYDNETYCLDALTGTRIWNYTTNGQVVSSPAVAYGNVYIGSVHYSIYCLNALTGTKVWNYTTDGSIDSSPTVADGRVYAGSMPYGNTFYCLNASTGDKLWSYTTGGLIRSVAAVAYGNVYVGSGDDNIYCLNESTGSQIWNSTTGSSIGSSPAVADNRVYIGSSDNKTYCFDAGDGRQIWNYTTNGLIGSSPAIVNSKIYVGSGDGNVYCLGSNQYGLLVKASGQGTTNATGTAFYDSGSLVSVVATPSAGWTLSYWLLDGSNVGSVNPYTVDLEKDTNLTAVFSETSPVQYELLVGVSGSGTTNVTSSHTYDAGSVISVQATPNSDWMLNQWLLNGSSVGSANPYTLTLSANYNLTAVFSEIPPIQYRLLVVVNGQGSTNTTGASMHNAGSVVSVQASPDAGWILNGWLLNGSSAGASDPFTVTMNANYNLTAVFANSSVTASAPLFTMLGEQVTEHSGGLNLSYTFRNHNSSAGNGSVWIPREQILCTVPLTKSTSGSVSGNLSEAEIPFDVNGDGETNDVFVVNYVDNATVQINGTTAHAQLPPGRRTVFSTPDGYGIYYTYDKASFQLGSKNLTLYSVNYSTENNTGYAELGLDSTLQYYPSPCLQLIIEQPVVSMDSTPPAEITSMKLNGTTITVASNYTESLTGEPGEHWIADRVYVYPLGSLQQNDAFTVDLSIKGEAGTYELMVVLDWSPDTVSRYTYPNVDVFAITGSVREAIQFGASTYPVEVLTNSTILQSTVYNWTAKTLSLNVTGFGGFSPFCNVTIPRSLLQGNPWAVDVDGSPTSFVAASNITHSFLYFDLNATAMSPQFFTSLVTIKGTLGLADTTPPHVSAMWTDPSGTIPPMTDVRVYVNATDAETGVRNATLYYSTGNESSWLAQLMAYNGSTGCYEAVIPAQQTGTQVKFKVVVFDNVENNVTMDSEYAVPADVWAPSIQGAAIAAAVSVSAVAVASAIASASSAAGSSAAGGASRLGEKLDDLLPSTVKKWLADAISSKHKVEVGKRSGHPLLLTRMEIFTYAVTTSVLTIAFAYAKAPSLGQILGAMPMILATSILIDFVKTYIVTAVSRRSGVWAEHRLWYLGMFLFAFSTLVFKVPFSSPSRLYHYSPKMTKRTGGLLSTLSILIAWAFAAAFLFLLAIGFRLVGSVGLVMCLTMAFFDTIPMPPMGGKGLYDWNKAIWLALFAVSLSSYGISLVLL